MPGNEVDRWYIMIYTIESIVYCSYQALVDQFLSEASFVICRTSVASVKIVFKVRKFVEMYATNHPHFLKVGVDRKSA